MQLGHTYIIWRIFSLGRFYAVLIVFVHDGDILRKVFWRISAPVLKDYNTI